jgi:PHD/YefM family antitoxin component YafN of YafNO toxin-antitoxin module
MKPDRDTYSLIDFKKNTPGFLKQLKDTGEPLVLTIDGKAELVVQDATSYQKLLEFAEDARVIEGVRRGLDDMRAGRGRPAADVFAEIRRDLSITPEA